MLAAALTLAGAPPDRAKAQDTQVFNHSVSTHTGTSLPPFPLPNGHDEIRSSDGTACRTNVANSGAYLDFGMLGSQHRQSDEALGVYARVVVPLGERPRRLDCTAIYELEVERLRLELEMVRMGLRGGLE